MIVIKNRIIPFEGYSTINLFGILFTKKDNLSEKTLNHESIHTKQMIEMGFIFFYLWYCIEYIIVRFFHSSQNKAYRDISFEEEAYAHDTDMEYLKNRKPYSWWKYLKIKKGDSK